METLSKDNYDTWRIQVEALLIKNDTWEYVTGEKTKPEIVASDAASANSQKTWIIQDRKAKSDLILSIQPSELKQIRGCETSKQVWDKLESIYSSKGPRRKASLLRQLTQLKMLDGQNIREHLSTFSDAVDKLHSMNVEINGDLLSILLLNTLPNSFENFRCAIESRDNLPDVESLKQKIIEEFDARVQISNETESGAMFVKSQRRTDTSKNAYGSSNNKDDIRSSVPRIKYKCNFCKKVGHKAAQCYEKRKSLNKKVGVAEETFHVNLSANADTKSTNHSEYTNRWCLDSGCTSHLCNNADSFSSLQRMQCGLKLASNAQAQVKAKGDVKISTTDGKLNKSVKLENTLFVPDLRINLMSVAKIVDKQCKISFNAKQAIVSDLNGNVKLIADREGDLYYLRDAPQSACTVSSDNLTDATIWHQRMGHLNFKDLNFMKRNRIVSGLNFKDHIDSSPCKSCVSGKLTSRPFPKRSERSSSLLEIVHADTCGPMKTKSKGGARYILTLTDDYSRWCEVYFLTHKSEVSTKFVEYKRLVENQTSHKIKFLQSDNGTEFRNAAMDEILRNSGIRRRLTVAYTPQQNGVAERKNRTLVEAARCMLIQSGLPPSFWAEAIATANYIRNRCVTKSLDEGTPYEKWNRKRPDVRHFRIFGCKVEFLDKTPHKDKLQSKTLEGIFVGYSVTSKAYRIWVPAEGKIKISRDVVFYDEFEKENLYEDIIYEETTNGRFNLFNDNSDIREISETVIGLNHRNEVVETVHEPIPAAIPITRGRGRPKRVMTGKRGRPRKRHRCQAPNTNIESYPKINEENRHNENLQIGENLASDEKHDLPEQQPKQDDNEEWHNAELAMSASEIPLSKATSGPDSVEWMDAIYSEMKCLVSNDTWKIVDKPQEGKVIGSRIVLRNKYASDGNLERRKARVVAQGFTQRAGIDFYDTFAPVARLSSLRLLMSLAAKFNLNVSQLDVTTAYLNGIIDTDIFMETPKFLNEMLERIVQEESDVKLVKQARTMLDDLQDCNKVCKLQKAIYGLRQSGRQWHIELDKNLRNIGLAPTNADPCVYVEKEGMTFVLVYVDDILIVSNSIEKERFIKSKLSQAFKIKDLGPAKYCLGIEIRQEEDKIYLSQSGYIRDILMKLGMQDSKPVSTPLASGTKLTLETQENDDDNHPFRELIGALMYLAVGTRPDIAYAVSALSQFNSCHNHSHWIAAKRILRYLKGTTDLSLIYCKDEEEIKGYVDADWGGCIIDRRSYTGYTFILSGASISWESRKQRTVALSSTEAEYMALTCAAKEAIHLIGFMNELGFRELAKVVIFNDNQSAEKLAANPVFHARSKHIDIKHHFVREALKRHPIKLLYLQTEKMIADVLTKPLTGPKHDFCAGGLGLTIQIFSGVN